MNKKNELGVILLNSLKNEVDILNSLKSFIKISDKIFFLNLLPEFSSEKIKSIYPKIIWYEKAELKDIFFKIEINYQFERFLIVDTRYQLTDHQEILNNENNEVQFVRLSNSKKKEAEDLSINKFEYIPLNFSLENVIYLPLLVKRNYLQKFSGSDFNNLFFEGTISHSVSRFSLTVQDNYQISKDNTPFAEKIISIIKKITEFDQKKLRNISFQISFYKENETNVSTEKLTDLSKQFVSLNQSKKNLIEEIKNVNSYLLKNEKKELLDFQSELYFFYSLMFLFGDFPDNQEEIKEQISKLSKIYPESIVLLFTIFVLNYNLNNFSFSKKIIFLLLSLEAKKVFLKSKKILPSFFLEKDFYYFLLAINSYKEGDYDHCRLYSAKIEKKSNYRDALNSLKTWTDSQIINIPTLERIYRQNELKKKKLAFISLRLAREYFLECNLQKSFYFYQLAREAAIREKNQDIYGHTSSEILKNAKFFLINSEISKNIFSGNENDLLGRGWYNFNRGDFLTAYEDFSSYLRRLEIKVKSGDETIEQINQEQISSITSKLKEIILSFRQNEELYQNIFWEIAVLAKELNVNIEESKNKFCQIFSFLQKKPDSLLKSYIEYVINEYLSLICLLENKLNEAKIYAEKALKFLPESVFLQKVAEILPEDEYAKVIRKVFFRYHTLQYKEEFYHFLREFERLKPKKVIEIGTYEGGSLLAMAHFLEAESELISIDTIPEEKMESLKIEIKTLGKNLKPFFVSGDSHSAKILNEVKKILRGKKVDLIFIDGDHTYEGVKSDFELYSPLVSKRGVIAIHDIQKYPAQYIFQVDLLWKKLALRYQVKRFIYNEQSPGIGLVYANSLKKKKKYSFSDLLLRKEKSDEGKKIMEKFAQGLNDLKIITTFRGKRILKTFNNIIFTNFTNNRLNNYLKSYTYVILLIEDFSSADEELKILLTNASGVLINGEKMKRRLAEIDFREYLEISADFWQRKPQKISEELRKIFAKMINF